MGVVMHQSRFVAQTQDGSVDSLDWCPPVLLCPVVDYRSPLILSLINSNNLCLQQLLRLHFDTNRIMWQKRKRKRNAYVKKLILIVIKSEGCGFNV